ncbi:MAG: low affinity iron permease family protein [Xanthomonadales bacterium]|nr:low affinity iron permease family protein [Xanthomonadaceae bacterium]MBN8223414.1 low affinity iron permease family protein [Xanthomonadales bacterium]MCA0197655.1 low affinity iron permease family protein [Pseudomonadota bacterium]HRF83966.1 low affinity iron permease family protein [Pseudoxanthomonas sp.]
MHIDTLFNLVAKRASRAAGTPWVFCLALAVVAAWALSGPVFGFNDTWQLAINTGTTIVTFLMVFLIQHTQNADTAAIHLKLDELIRATREADNILLDMEEMDERELEAIRKRYEALADMARRKQEPRGASPCRDGD